MYHNISTNIKFHHIFQKFTKEFITDDSFIDHLSSSLKVDKNTIKNSLESYLEESTQEESKEYVEDDPTFESDKNKLLENIELARVKGKYYCVNTGNLNDPTTSHCKRNYKIFHEHRIVGTDGSTELLRALKLLTQSHQVKKPQKSDEDKILLDKIKKERDLLQEKLKEFEKINKDDKDKYNLLEDKYNKLNESIKNNLEIEEKKLLEIEKKKKEELEEKKRLKDELELEERWKKELEIAETKDRQRKERKDRERQEREKRDRETRENLEKSRKSKDEKKPKKNIDDELDDVLSRFN